MENKKLSYLSFADIRALASRAGGENRIMPYMKGDIGMLLSAGQYLSYLIHAGTPYLMEEPRIAILKHGTAHVIVNMMERELHENTLIFLNKGTVIQPVYFSPDYELCGMMVSNERFGQALGTGIRPALADGAASFAVEVSEEEAAVAYRMFSLCWDLLHREDEDTPGEAVNGLLHTLVYYYDDMNKRGRSESAGRGLHSRQMFERFISLVNAHCREERSLDFYAGKMCVTARYLGTVVKSASGITAKEWLDRAVATSAKVLLRHTDRQITEIADTLHFSNTAFFCKFFRRMTGQSPQGYRRSPAKST